MENGADRDVGQSLGWRTFQRIILGRSRRPRVSVLIFHRVLRERDPLRPNEPVIGEFERLVRFLSANFKVRMLRDAVADAIGGGGDKHCVAITFDDGYADNVENAMPVLKKYGVPATFFITSGTLDSGIMWNDRILHAIRASPHGILDLEKVGLGRLDITGNEQRTGAVRRLIGLLKYREFAERDELVAAIEQAAVATPPPRLMMTRQQVQQLTREPLADIGGHTVSHPILARLPDREAEREIAGGKESLEALSGRQVRCFAYPNGIPDGDYSATHVDMVRNAGFELAVSTSSGGFGPGDDVYQIPRIKPWDRRPFAFGVRMLTASRLDGKSAAGWERGRETSNDRPRS